MPNDQGRGKRTVNPFSKVGVCAAEDGDSEVVVKILSAQEFFSTDGATLRVRVRRRRGREVGPVP